MSTWEQQPTVNTYTKITHRVRDAHGAACNECNAEFSVFNQRANAPWRKSQGLHERGTGHAMTLFRLEFVARDVRVGGQP